jgi:hypothetical protein
VAAEERSCHPLHARSGVAFAGFAGAVLQLSVVALGLGAVALGLAVVLWPREDQYRPWVGPSRRRRPVPDAHDSALATASMPSSMDIAEELRSALAAGRAVKPTTFDGRRFGYVGVGEVDPDGRWVDLITPMTFGDVTTRRRVDIDDIDAVAVARIRWPEPD